MLIDFGKFIEDWLNEKPLTIDEMLDLGTRLKLWMSPGGYEFFVGVRDQFERRGRLSPKQVIALRNVIRYAQKSRDPDFF
jgi:hypothetical protein